MKIWIAILFLSFAMPRAFADLPPEDSDRMAETAGENMSVAQAKKKDDVWANVAGKGSCADYLGMSSAINSKNTPGCCKVRVYNYLVQNGIMDRMIAESSAAANGMTELPRAGMKASTCSPTKPSDGCTCVYSGGTYGHIEVYREGCGWWYGTGCQSGPMTEQGLGTSGQRVLAGCFK